MLTLKAFIFILGSSILSSFNVPICIQPTPTLGFLLRKPRERCEIYVTNNLFSTEHLVRVHFTVTSCQFSCLANDRLPL